MARLQDGGKGDLGFEEGVDTHPPPRGSDVEYEDPVVDSDGNVQRPRLVEGFTAAGEEPGATCEVCGEPRGGFCLGAER